MIFQMFNNWHNALCILRSQKLALASGGCCVLVCRPRCEHQYQVPPPSHQVQSCFGQTSESGAEALRKAGGLVDIEESLRYGLGGRERGGTGDI